VAKGRVRYRGRGPDDDGKAESETHPEQEFQHLRIPSELEKRIFDSRLLAAILKHC